VRRATRRTPPLARRRRAGVAASSLGPARQRRPPPAFSHGALTDRIGRENPNRVGGGGQQALRLSPLAFESPAPPGQGEIPGLPRLGPPGRPWRRRLPFLCDLGHRGMARGQKGPSLPRPGSFRVRARPTPRRACRLGDPAVPRPASWCGETGGALGAAR
jgi:hypothetical protein